MLASHIGVGDSPPVDSRSRHCGDSTELVFTALTSRLTGIEPDTAVIADAVWHVPTQPESAWTFEFDVVTMSGRSERGRMSIRRQLFAHSAAR